jgi:hypothetical protein
MNILQMLAMLLILTIVGLIIGKIIYNAEVER